MARIICIEDDEMVREDLTEILEEAGHVVETAGSVSDGLDAINSLNPDLILTDLSLPDSGGLDLVKTIRREMPFMAEVPIIVVTGQVERSEMLAGFAAGADEYLTKPIEFDVLLAKINAMLRQVGRIRAQKESEHVRLYKALTKPAQPAESADGNIDVTLVGTLTPSMHDFKSTLENIDCSVTVFESGQEFLDAGRAAADIVIVSYYTNDIQGEVVMRWSSTSTEADAPLFVLTWPAERKRVNQQMVHTVNGCPELHLPETDIQSRLNEWLTVRQHPKTCDPEESRSSVRAT